MKLEFLPRFFTRNSSFRDSSSIQFHLLFFLLFWVHVRLHPRGNGLELEFVKLKFQKQSNLLNYFIRMLYGKFFSKTLLANFAHIYICIFSTKLERNSYKHLRSNYSILYEDTFMSNINMSNMMTYNNLSECQD